MRQPDFCVCKKCKNTWLQRTLEKPKMCPRCKTYDWEMSRLRKAEKKWQ